MQDAAPVVAQREFTPQIVNAPEFEQPKFAVLAVKTVICHTVTYFAMGIWAFRAFHYAEMINQPNSGMRHLNEPMVALGMPLQAIRGVLFASVFYLFREGLFGRKNGWLRMSWLLVGLGILGTFAAPPGSVEGFIFTTTPVWIQLRSYLEIVSQAVLLSVLLCYWVAHPGKKWLSWSLGAAYALCVGLPILGFLAQRAAGRLR
jgi:magnesium-transporting ATPase (P-type)